MRVLLLAVNQITSNLALNSAITVRPNRETFHIRLQLVSCARSWNSPGVDGGLLTDAADLPILT